MANNKLITDDFKLHQIRQFVESITEPANTIYYVFAGKPTEYITGDSNIDAPNNDVESLTTLVYDEMAFAKHVTSNDVKSLIKRYDWTPGTVYDMYDSLSENGKELKNKAFYVASKEGSVYYIFKCLYNNKGSPSTSQPIFSATSADDVYYETADGYVWKYMYKVDETTFFKFATIDYIPVTPDANVSANAINGEIDVIKVISGGRDYNNFLSGRFTESDVRFNGISTQYRISSSNAVSNTDFYQGCILKIIAGGGSGQYRRILSYGISGGFNVLTVDEPFNVTPANSDFEISPEVIINGDGRHTINAEARALVNTNASNSIYNVEILHKGKDYRLAEANVYVNTSAKLSNSTNQAVLRVIYSPKGGHGYDVESELFATAMGVSVKFSNNEYGQISTDNDYRRVGLLKDPLFNDVKITYDLNTLKGGFVDTEEIIQAKLNRINGTVSVNSNTKNIFSIGTLNAIQIGSSGNVLFANTDVLTVSNVTINAISSVLTNSTAYIISANLLSTGYGISDGSSPVITIANSSGGNIRHVNSNIITGVSASANGRAYTNSDFIVITSTTATVNGIASITTNSIGGIAQITITNSGKGFQNNEVGVIQIVDGGLGYANGPITFNGGGGTGAVANSVTDSVGNVTSIVFFNRGTNYTSVPTITMPGSPSATGTFNVFLRTKNLTVYVANSSAGYSNGAKISNVITNANGDIGVYSNTDTMIFVSPSSIHGNAIANVVTAGDGSFISANVNAGNNFGFNIGNTNLDYFVANSAGGFKRRFESKIVTSVVVSNSAPSYKVSGISISQAGQNYNSTKVLRVDVADGGTGYNSTANNILIFTAVSGGSGANATFTNSSSGKIISVTMVANGTGYLAAPTVSPNSQANGIGANLVAVLANSITISSTVGGYGGIAFFGNNTSGNVTSISLANSGFGYTSAPTATISDTVGTGAVFSVTIDGGANCFATNDLFIAYGGTANAQGNAVANSTLFLTSVDLTDSGEGFDTTNLKIKVANSSGGNTRFFNGTIVKEITVANSGLVNSFVNTDIIYVTNGSINAVANAIANSSAYLTGVNLVISGLGFANVSTLNMFAVNSTGGDIRYFNTNVVSSITISDGGTGYVNTDSIIISSPGGEDARANVETTEAGTIVSTKLSNRGRRIIPWYISNLEIISAGSGYSNTDIIEFCGGGGTGANAIFMTDINGAISKLYLVTGGENYDCAPSIRFANSTGGISSGLNAVIVANLNRSTTFRIVNANGNPSSGTFADLSPIVRSSANLVANLIYSATIGSNSELVTLSTPANIEVQISDSSNLYFTAIQSANISLLLADNRTTFDSSISAGDKIYLQTPVESQVLTVQEVANSTWLKVTQNPAFTNDQVAISIAKINARGFVKERGVDYVKVTNAYGFFAQSNDIIGVSSRSSANVTQITYNGISKTGTNVDQLLTYYVQQGDNPLSFEEEETVRGGTGNLSIAYIHSANSTAFRVTNPTGIFSAGNTVLGESSGATVTLRATDSYKYEGDFVRGSGDVIYIESVEPISRGNSQSETVKLILEF